MTEDKKAKKSEADDRKLVSMMGMAMLDNGGLDTLQKGLEQSQDPAQVISNFMAQLIGQQAEYTQQTFGINPAVYTQKGGFLDQIVDYIERKLGLPPDMSDQVYGETIEVMKALAQEGGPQGGPQQGAPQGGPPQAGPPGPQAAPPGLDRGVM